MKKNVFYLLMLICSFSILTSCKDDDNSLPIEQKIAGAYKGTLDITMYADETTNGVEIAKDLPQKVYLAKVGDDAVKMELRNFGVMGLDFGTISVDRSTVLENNNVYSFAGEQVLDLSDKNLGKCTVRVDGTVTGSQILLNIDVIVPAPLDQTVKVKFTGSRLTGAESAEANITALTFDKKIAANSAVIMQPQIKGTDITFMVADTTSTETLKTLVPTITTSAKATVIPASGVAQDFSKAVKYTVIAEDGSQQEYRVSIANVMSFYGFEEWTEDNTLYTDTIPLAVGGWTSCNNAVALIKFMGSYGGIEYKGNYPIRATEESHSGKYAAELVSVDTKGGNLLGQNVPKVTAGSMFLGSFNAFAALQDPMATTSFGIVYAKKPLEVKGYFKYKPGTEFYNAAGVLVPELKDSCSITAVYYEVENEDETLNGSNIYTSDKIVAVASFIYGKEVSEYIAFNLKLDYISGKYNASKLHKFAIIFSASKDGAAYNAAIGSRLLIDDVEIINE